MDQAAKLKELCQKLATARGCHILCFVLPNDYLKKAHALSVRGLLWQNSCAKLAVLLHSSGGDINTAYQTAVFLRSHCEDLTTIVPLYAKSAATLFLLASNAIIMDELAEVGPLDTQMPEREKGGVRYASALNPLKTLEEIQKFTLTTLDLTAKLLLRRTDYSVDEAVTHAMTLAANMSVPLLSQLKTEKIGECSRALGIGEKYGYTLLNRYHGINKEKIDSVLAELVKGYPSHGYIIDHQELKELGFNISLPSGEESAILKEVEDLILELESTEIFLVAPEDAKPDMPGEGETKNE